MDKKNVSVIIPVYNEQNIIKELVARLEGATKDINHNFEFVFVNDGSQDNTLDELLSLSNTNKKIKIIDLSRNFGQQLAISAGLDYTKADAAILMDADLEDHPEDIGKFITKWEEGYDVVFALRAKRKVSILRRICFNMFHYLNNLICDIPMQASGLFGLMDRKVLEKIKAFRERNRYIPGLRSWVGFKQIGIELARGKRYDMKPRVKFIKLFSLAFNSYFSFSNLPLKISSVLGISLSFLTLSAAILIVILRLCINFKVPGWASLMVILLFVSSIQFICIGIIGEYVGRILDEVRNRPLYLVRNLYGINENDKAV